MEIPSIGARERSTLVILGAGATRRASFVAGDALVPPPLDYDFFQVLQMSATGRTPSGRALIDHVRTVYGPALNIGLETVFDNLDAARVFHATFKIARGRHLEEPRRLIDALRVVLPELLGETVGDECEFHAALASRLRVGDAVISLNYDCVMDRALADHAGFRFDPERGGYGVPVDSGADLWRRSGRGKTSCRFSTAPEAPRLTELALIDVAVAAPPRSLPRSRARCYCPALDKQACRRGAVPLDLACRPTRSWTNAPANHHRLLDARRGWARQNTARH
jgi:hypothetical protein